jgi:hypothetical protein
VIVAVTVAGGAQLEIATAAIRPDRALGLPSKAASIRAIGKHAGTTAWPRIRPDGTTGHPRWMVLVPQKPVLTEHDARFPTQKRK